VSATDPPDATRQASNHALHRTIEAVWRIERSRVIAGFSILQVKSLEEAIEWVKRGPNCGPGDYEVEIRQIFEMEDFAPILTEEQIKHKVAKRAELPNQTANK